MENTKNYDIADCFTPKVMGVISYQLDPDYINDPNFGKHTLKGIDELLLQEKRVEDIQEASEMLRGLNKIQVNGVVNFKLKREEVLDPKFDEKTLIAAYRTQRKNKRKHLETNDFRDSDTTEEKREKNKSDSKFIENTLSPTDKNLKAFTRVQYPQTKVSQPVQKEYKQKYARNTTSAAKKISKTI